MSRDIGSEPDLSEDTLPEICVDDRADDGRPRAPAREVRCIDFKDIYSQVDVSHGPTDPSRVWLMFESPEAVIHLSLEEGIARRLFERLGEILPRFREVRSRVDSTSSGR